MKQLYGVDISEFQGTVDWDALNAASNFVMIRSCFGTVRKDHQFDRNKAEAHRVQAVSGPLGVGYYHYAYPEYTGNTPEAEADFFVNNVSPLAPGDVLALDWEEQYGGDHVAWCLAFLQRVEAKTGVKPLLYLNQSLVKAHNWTPVIAANFGLWLADYDGNKTGLGVSTPWVVTAMRQWGDSDTVAGIAGTVDGDVFYGDFNAFAAYGYKQSTPAQPTPVQAPPPPAPAPAPAETPAQSPAPTSEPALSSSPVVSPPASPEPPVLPRVDPLSALPNPPVVNPSQNTPKPASAPPVQKMNWWQILIAWIKSWLAK